ncbi:hypothetical protein SCAR479_07453 [Seiridium cardinale]|uniref:Uncharacterized protein n=1 Tax=Seiridium cardinale TaxID=138064 RepID=A0ABR2XQ72_9PEZI
MCRKRYVSCDQIILGPDGNIDACFNGKRDGWIECEAVKKGGKSLPTSRNNRENRCVESGPPVTVIKPCFECQKKRAPLDWPQTITEEQATYDPAEHITKQWFETWLHSAEIFLSDNSKAIDASTPKPEDHAASPVPVTVVSSPVVRMPSSSLSPHSLLLPSHQQHIATSASPHHVKLETASPPLYGGSDQPFTKSWSVLEQRPRDLRSSLSPDHQSSFHSQVPRTTSALQAEAMQTPPVNIENITAQPHGMPNRLNQAMASSTSPLATSLNAATRLASDLQQQQPTPNIRDNSSSPLIQLDNQDALNQIYKRQPFNRDKQRSKATNGWKQGTNKIKYQGTNCNVTGQSAQGHATVEIFSKKRSHDMMSGNTRLIDGLSIVNGSPAQMRAEAHMHPNVAEFVNPLADAEVMAWAIQHGYPGVRGQCIGVQSPTVQRWFPAILPVGPRLTGHFLTGDMGEASRRVSTTSPTIQDLYDGACSTPQHYPTPQD